ncbi:MoxR-like ATPase [Azospirillum fermentarium]|uniref:AAA family ATPase n=1 Tax=Azospirillum fermentarium TaxID=1233114 RepID=UPI0022272A60|nr:AAA family ATPase [Azospirillum fermentarium]MCW2247735.1 MoxR-like ATPase [Azospirillum fermentarium]
MDQQTLIDLGQMDDVANLLEAQFIGRGEMIRLLVVCAVAQEHLLAVGPPGTGKSQLVRQFALLCAPENSGQQARIPYFEYVLTRFTEPNEIFGPVDILSLQSGGVFRRNVAGMLPQAEIAFFDEVFKANSAILNSLLAALNERMFHNGSERIELPLLFAIGATNVIPDDEELAALRDRFLVWAAVDNVEESQLPSLLHKGWEFELTRIAEGAKAFRQVNVTTTDALRRLHRTLQHVNLDPVLAVYRDVIRRIRTAGIPMSDRRVVKLLKLIAAAALRRNSMTASPADLWVLRHVWQRPDHMPLLRGIVDPYVAAHQDEDGTAGLGDLGRIQEELSALAARASRLKTDADFADHLQQLEGLRRTVLRWRGGVGGGDTEAADSVQQRIDGMVEELLTVLEGLP